MHYFQLEGDLGIMKGDLSTSWLSPVRPSPPSSPSGRVTRGETNKGRDASPFPTRRQRARATPRRRGNPARTPRRPRGWHSLQVSAQLGPRPLRFPSRTPAAAVSPVRVSDHLRASALHGNVKTALPMGTGPGGWRTHTCNYAFAWVGSWWDRKRRARRGRCHELRALQVASDGHILRAARVLLEF